MHKQKFQLYTRICKVQYEHLLLARRSVIYAIRRLTTRALNKPLDVQEAKGKQLLLEVGQEVEVLTSPKCKGSPLCLNAACSYMLVVGGNVNIFPAAGCVSFADFAG